MNTAEFKYVGAGIMTFLAMWLMLSQSGCRESGQANAAETASRSTARPTPVSVEVVAAETREEVRRLNGDVLPWSVVPILFKVGGRITQLPIEEGQQIAVNQFIGALDTRDYRLVRDLARAQVDALNPHLDRALILKDANVVPQSKVDELTGKMEVARVQKNQADTQLSYTRLYSPVQGVLLQKKASVGEMTDPQHPVAIVAQMEKVKVVLPVAQRDVPHFRVGDVLSLTTPEIAHIFEGRIHAVGYAAEERTRTFPVTLEVSNPDLKLRAGMIVEATVKVGEHTGIFISLDAITRSQSGVPIVMLVDPQRAVAVSRIVTPGAVLGEKVEIRSGLAIGDKVIVRGQVSENDPVQIQ
jgi:RND family efflux transporter MFP subunit